MIDLVRETGQDILMSKQKFTLSTNLWGKYDSLNLHELEWSEIKFLNSEGNDMHEDMDGIPSNTGGLYFFYIKLGIIPNTDYLVYIGRAQYTENQNLKKRCKSYYQNYRRGDERPKIDRMIETYGENLYIRYIQFTDNETIIELEAKLINSILPPFNTDIPDPIIKKAVKAFDNL